MEEQSARSGEANGCPDYRARLGDVVDDAVADNGVELRRGKYFGVGMNEFNSIGKAGGGDVRAGQRQHAFRGVDRSNVNAGRTAAKLDGDLRCSGAQVENSQLGVGSQNWTADPSRTVR